ncbi:MAG TPA: hypothetical protein VMT72_09330 [Pseudolabrys sp.]|nr:hypothetical protein [Pseudolabrys sp.]
MFDIVTHLNFYNMLVDDGCTCAEHMEDDYVRPRAREKALKSASSRKKRWLGRRWCVSAYGNDCLNTDVFNITVFRNSDHTWGGRIEESFTERFVRRAKIVYDKRLSKVLALHFLTIASAV